MKNGKGDSSFSRIVSTINLRDLVNSLKDMPKEIKAAADSLKFNSMYLTMIGVRGKFNHGIHWMYLPEKEILPNRISFPSHMSLANAPEGMSSILAETTFDPNAPKEKPENVSEKVIDNLHSNGILNRKDVAMSKTISIKYAYPIYDLDYLKNSKAIYDYIDGLGNLHLLGRFGEFKYYNVDKCIRRAMDLSETIKNI